MAITTDGKRLIVYGGAYIFKVLSARLVELLT